MRLGGLEAWTRLHRWAKPYGQARLHRWAKPCGQGLGEGDAFFGTRMRNEG